MTTKVLIRYFHGLLIIAALLAGANVRAEQQTPDQVIDETSKAILQQIASRKDELRNDSSKLYKLVEDIVIPHFDFDAISRRVLGKTWKDASEEQRGRFSEAFKNLLVRTYSTALLEYSGESIDWKPLEAAADATKVTKQAEVTLSSGQVVPMNWGLHKVQEGWKVYDINIDGISLVTNYRSVFAGEVRKNGLDSLIQRLESKNATDGANS